jgi:hypothetical protein
MLYVYGMCVPPEVIYIIRHAEKPLKLPLFVKAVRSGRLQAVEGV